MITAALVSAKSKTDGTRKVSATPAFRCYVLLNVIKRQQTEQLCNLCIAWENVWNSVSFPNTMVVWMTFALTDSYILMLGPQLVELWGKNWLGRLCWKRFVSWYELWDSKSLLWFMFSFSVVFGGPEVSSRRLLESNAYLLGFVLPAITVIESLSEMVSPSPYFSISCFGVLSQQWKV